ncbi:hypothetical protein L210DRAFT_3402807, partial [Boletus edulis BED1]
GRLAGLVEMPMDILFEIFGHLMPLDVLHLTHTTKQFRQLIMHRSSASIWVAARKNVSDLPDCPPYMSEPQFANLVFDTHCHVRFAHSYSRIVPDHIPGMLVPTYSIS